MKKLLIVGGSGFIGRRLIDKLKSKYAITSVSHTGKVSGVDNINLDLVKTDFGFLDSTSFDAAIYLGTVSSPKEAEAKPQLAYDTNVTVVQRFLEKAGASGVKKIILFSSAVLYSINDDPCSESDSIEKYSSIYNYSKYSLETLADYYRLKHNMQITVFRLSNTYGPGQTNTKAPYLVPGLFQQASEKGEIEVWNIKPIRDWVFVDDVVKVVELELKIKGGGLFNLGTGKGRSVGDLVKIVADLYKVRVVDLDKPVAPPYKVVCNIQNLKTRLNYVPDTDLVVGLKKVYEFYKYHK